MTIEEYGVFDVRDVEGERECFILCTLPERLLKRVSELKSNMKFVVDNRGVVFVDVPDEELYC